MLTEKTIVVKCNKTGSGCYGLKEMSLLFEISNLLNSSRNVKENLPVILRMISNYADAQRVMLTILNRETGKIFIEVAHGLTDEEIALGHYAVGEGIIGKVVATGTQVMIPKISESAEFLNKTRNPLTIEGQEISFFCIPVRTDEMVIGTLSFTRIYNAQITVDETIRLLSIIGTIIAKAVRSRQKYIEEIERLRTENRMLHYEIREKQRFDNMIGRSGKMQYVYDLIQRVAATSTTVLIRGESGVGKELIADALHFNSLRAGKEFVKVNCAALPESLIESELFGHEKGAFTGAQAQRKGRFEMAHGGTIFLDEIGDLPMQTQVKLLRIIQQREFERLGSCKPIACDVRIVCATNRNLEEMIAKGVFRDDLYYRINVFPVYVPALRERITDIPALVDHFIGQFNHKNAGNIKRISAAAIDMLMMYHWPGNIRELENCVERSCILSTDNVIRCNNLPPTLQTAQSSDTMAESGLELILENMEKQLIVEALQTTRGNVLKASEKLQVTERMLGIRIRKYGIDPRQFKISHRDQQAEV